WPRPSTAESTAAELPTSSAVRPRERRCSTPGETLLDPGRDRFRPRTELRARRIVERAVPWGKRSDSACTVRADGDAALFARKLRPMPDQEAFHAGELIVLFGQDANGELFVRQVGARQLEALGYRGLVLVDLARLRLRTLSSELRDRVALDLIVLLARCVVICCHMASSLSVQGVLRRTIVSSREMCPQHCALYACRWQDGMKTRCGDS